MKGFPKSDFLEQWELGKRLGRAEGGDYDVQIWGCRKEVGIGKGKSGID